MRHFTAQNTFSEPTPRIDAPQYGPLAGSGGGGVPALAQATITGEDAQPLASEDGSILVTDQ